MTFENLRYEIVPNTYGGIQGLLRLYALISGLLDLIFQINLNGDP